jgi:hypothetical protein
VHLHFPGDAGPSFGYLLQISSKYHKPINQDYEVQNDNRHCLEMVKDESSFSKQKDKIEMENYTEK